MPWLVAYRLSRLHGRDNGSFSRFFIIGRILVFDNQGAAAFRRTVFQLVLEVHTSRHGQHRNIENRTKTKTLRGYVNFSIQLTAPKQQLVRVFAMTDTAKREE